ncbi:MAG TPA: hypothetical protein VNL70_07215, partial [Tepidisphaeraceae bacterium]|nr:hypothetical protein [Tepidisphaeraceae bacterium]
INTSRAMMLMVGVALGVVLGVWSWQLGGATAAIVAVALFSFDPNFIAHAPLVKNDVSLSLAMLCVAWVCWSVGRRAAWWNVLLLAGLCGVAAGVKFSGVIVGPIVLLMLLARARLVPDCWPVFGRELRGRSARVLAALAVCVVAVAVGAAVLWAAYGFRFRPTPVAGAVLDTQAQVRKLKECRFFLANQRWPNQADEAVIDAMPTPVFARAVLFAQRHRLLPQTWLYGLLFTYRSTLVRTTYLLGQHSETGWWYYFPLAMLFKTPLATLAAMVGAVVLKLGWRLRRSNSSVKISRFTPDRWSALCLTIPLIVYGASALTSNLNLGLRHVLPVYPFIYVLVGLTAAKMVAWRPGAASLVALVLGMGLIIETVRAFPHYISFFNVPSRPHRLWLLSDSNFDWGQDLTFVAEWRRRHPHVKLYLGYLGSVDPAFYGIDYTNIPGGYQLNPQWEWPPREPGVVAISATVLQGVNVPPSVIRLYAPLRARRPEQMIGDTIYVYDWPLR